MIVSLRRTLLPFDLTGFYPIPQDLSLDQPKFLACAFLVIALSVAAFTFRKRWPALGMAWLAQIVILAPNLGLFEFNSALTADRYTYLSSLGWIVALALVAKHIVKKEHVKVATVFGSMILVLIASWAFRLCHSWRDTETFWNHVIAHGGETSAIAQSNLGAALSEKGDLTEAESRLLEAVRLAPEYSDAHNDLASIYYRQGKIQEAKDHLQQSVHSQPNNYEYRRNLAVALLKLGNFSEAESQLRTAIDLNPGNKELRNMLNFSLQKQGRNQ